LIAHLSPENKHLVRRTLAAGLCTAGEAACEIYMMVEGHLQSGVAEGIVYADGAKPGEGKSRVET